jgi:hypothetical protein
LCGLPLDARQRVLHDLVLMTSDLVVPLSIGAAEPSVA